MTKQEVFNKVYETLRERGFTRAGTAGPTGDFSCCYRSEVGPCAIGIFIPDDLYDPKFEGYTVNDLLLEEKLVIPTFEDIPLRFLSELQDAHDNGRTPDIMERALRLFAHDYRLEVPE